MPNRPEIIRHLIAQQRAAGINPVEIHMNAQTRKEFAAESEIKPEEAPDRRSLLSRIRDPHIPTAAILRFEGVRIVDNEAIAGGGMLLRPMQLMGDPDWLETIQWATTQAKLKAHAEQQASEADGDTSWHQREPVGEASVSGDVLSDLAQGGGVNPTTVLMRAFDGLDKIEDVVVLRFYKGGSIDLCSSMKKYAVIGALQAALGYVANRDDD